MLSVFEVISSSKNAAAEELLAYQYDGAEEYWKPMGNQNVLGAEEDGAKNENMRKVNEYELDSSLPDRDQWKDREYRERSERWYEYPIDYVCMKGARGERL
jgi:hypothetical protein